MYPSPFLHNQGRHEDEQKQNSLQYHISAAN